MSSNPVTQTTPTTHNTVPQVAHAPIIAVDFDGTITKENNYPHCGELMPGAIAALKALKSIGCTLILWTCREGDPLAAAVEHCRKAGIEFDAVNEQAPQVRELFGGARKVFANFYVDDLNVGGNINWAIICSILRDRLCLEYGKGIEELQVLINAYQQIMMEEMMRDMAQELMQAKQRADKLGIDHGKIEMQKAPS